MFDILTILPGKKKTTSSHWHSFNAVCCGHRGHRPDRRMRGGIMFDGPTNWRYNCFNCQFTCNFVLGRPISLKTRQLLTWCGIDPEQTQLWSLESLQHKDMLDIMAFKKTRSKLHFDEIKLPEGESLDLNNPEHHRFIEYLERRSIEYDSYPFMVTPKGLHRQKNRIIVPYTYHKKIVGYTSRYLDQNQPKYINEQQPGYVFGYDFQRPNWQFAILVEGIFDALSINGLALTHNTINDDQALMMAQLNRQIIMVPDHDKAGLDVCDRALELGYQVSMPEWGPGIKDVNDAVVKYGRVPTLISIIQNATGSKIKIEMARKKIEKDKAIRL